MSARRFNRVHRDSNSFRGLGTAAVMELEAMPEFQRYAELLRACIANGTSSEELGEATRALAARCRRTDGRPETILKALHRADLGTDVTEGHTNEAQSRSYLRALRQLLSWYYEER